MRRTVLACLLLSACASTPSGLGAPSAAPTSPGTTGARPTATSAASVTTQQLPARPAPRSALALLATLVVKGRGPKTGYARDQFGPAWADVDRNGCDTRDDILTRDLTGRTYRAGTHGCVVLSGTLHDPYTGRFIRFAKSDATAVQIDHVVALSDAWQKGAAQWAAGKRLAFANDPLNLLAVDGPTNEAKGDGDAATWLPPYQGFRCAYVARQVAVKARYGVSVTAAERDAIARVLSSCPAQPVPGGGAPTVAATGATPTVAGVKTYANCAALHVDYPGGVARPGAVNQGGRTTKKPYYSQALYDANSDKDRDKDGVACEV